MAKINFPKNENTFDAWFTNFQQAFNANARKFGFTTTDVKTVNQFFKAWQTWTTTVQDWNEFNTSFTKFQKAQFTSFQSFVMGYWNEIVTNPAFNGNAKAWFGNGAPNKSFAPKTRKTTGRNTTTAKATTTKSTTRKSTTVKSTVKPTTRKSTIKATTGTRKTTSRGITATRGTTTSIYSNGRSTNGVYTNGRATTNKTTNKTTRGRTTAKKTVNVPTSVPFVWFSSYKNGSVNVYVGSTVNGGFQLPAGASGAAIQYRYGRQSWRKLTQGATFPFVHNTNSIDAKKITYRACWVYGNKKGPWSATFNYNINTLKAA
ncbi:MAG: hypothetical protein KIT11_01715 [Fimbriimonadaceae bacterium]|nr:hypothetical protein [Fimbriimonadaceae bacterium]QYK54912.1 MAG: hypothetical protein KF733_07820 [Fimbriimonadaceae bacterium]